MYGSHVYRVLERQVGFKLMKQTKSLIRIWGDTKTPIFGTFSLSTPFMEVDEGPLFYWTLYFTVIQ